MHTESHKYRKYFARVLGILTVLLLLTALGARAATGENPKPWAAPALAKSVKNPVQASPETLAAGAKLFQENCAACHGDKGAGDGEMAQYLKQKPANFTDAKAMSEATDGELFWKMSEGRGAMPSWKDQLTEAERWQLVIYLRTLTPKITAQENKNAH